SRRSRRSRARNTVPIPPRAASPMISKRPATRSPCCIPRHDTVDGPTRRPVQPHRWNAVTHAYRGSEGASSASDAERLQGVAIDRARERMEGGDTNKPPAQASADSPAFCHQSHAELVTPSVLATLPPQPVPAEPPPATTASSAYVITRRVSWRRESGFL